LALVALLLTLAPFAAALEVHHALAAADQDGHEHSDSDLCQWVQHHTGHSVLSGQPSVSSVAAVDYHEYPNSTGFVSSALIFIRPSRAPPVV
ncbi:MAG: hypothetical protein C4294_08095, partial [Nitrospiraceae bacterium]